MKDDEIMDRLKRMMQEDPDAWNELMRPIEELNKHALDLDTEVKALLLAKPLVAPPPSFPWREFGEMIGKTDWPDNSSKQGFSWVSSLIEKEGVVVKKAELERRLLVFRLFCFDLVAVWKYYGNAEAARACREGIASVAARRYLSFFQHVDVDKDGIAAQLQRYANHLTDQSQPLHLGIPYNIAKRFLIDLQTPGAEMNPILSGTMSVLARNFIVGQDAGLAGAIGGWAQRH